MTPKEQFIGLVCQWQLRYFTADELLVKVGSVKNGVVNKFPPENLWNNLKPTAMVVDELRHRLGVPIKVLSGYRSKEYNKQIGGVGNSQHSQFRALDISSTKVTPRRIWEELRKMRTEGKFKGGLGIYGTFVHVDTRLSGNADWSG